MKYPRIWIAAKGGPIKAAKCEDAPIEVLFLLAKDADWTVRWEVAWNWKTPEDILRFLAEDKDWRVCQEADMSLRKRGLA